MGERRNHPLPLYRDTVTPHRHHRHHNHDRFSVEYSDSSRACAAGRPRRVTSRRRHRYGRAAIGHGRRRSARPPPPIPRHPFPYMGQRRASFIKRRYTSPRCAVWAVRSFSVYGRRIRHTRRARLQFNKSTGVSITCVCVTVCVSVHLQFLYRGINFFTCDLECAPPYIVNISCSYIGVFT